MGIRIGRTGEPINYFDAPEAVAHQGCDMAGAELLQLHLRRGADVERG